MSDTVSLSLYVWTKNHVQNQSVRQRNLHINSKRIYVQQKCVFLVCKSRFAPLSLSFYASSDARKPDWKLRKTYLRMIAIFIRP